MIVVSLSKILSKDQEAQDYIYNFNDFDWYKNYSDYIAFTEFIQLMRITVDDESLLQIGIYLKNFNEFLELNYYLYTTLNVLPIGYPYNHIHLEDNKYRINNPTEALLNYLIDPTPTTPQPTIEYNLENEIAIIKAEEAPKKLIRNLQSYYWKIDELLTLKCIQDLNLDKDNFDRFLNKVRTFTISGIATELDITSIPGTEDYLQDKLVNELKEAHETIKKLSIENESLKQQLEQSQSSRPNDEPTHHKSVGSMTVLIATILKLAEYDKDDLKQPHGAINKEIQAKADGLGLSIKKDFIEKWLKKADDIL